MNDLNWAEFRQVVPSQISTVLVPIGTLGPHGVAKNGADNTAPVAVAEAIAADVNALIVPNIPHHRGHVTVPRRLQRAQPAFRAYFQAVVEGLVKNGFRNIILLNGHGGGQTAVTETVLCETAPARNVNTLTVNWWLFCSDAKVAALIQETIRKWRMAGPE